jgi:hypothetical protein
MNLRPTVQSEGSKGPCELGIGAKLVAVPSERLQIDRERDVTLPGATRDSLRDLPEFKYPA